MNDRPEPVQRFVVVKNSTGRTSCWPIDRAIPVGWIATENTGTKPECLEAIRRTTAALSSPSADDRHLRMSLMFFGDSEDDATGDKYRMLFEAARFADQHRFEGLWLPERHFTKFGCLYPSPAVLQAALAGETRQLRLRAGSVVMPLNDPVRVAEEWAVVDNLSAGRVELAFASGWHQDDFALMPQAYEDRNERMFDGIRDLQRLWKGETIQRRNGAGQKVSVRTYPTPVQEDLPIWLTAAGSPETFRRAGEMGFGVLTHLFHQDVSELQQKILLYRAARKEAGFKEIDGRVAVTLHTFVGSTMQDVRSKAGRAYCDYLRANLGLLKQLAFSQGQSMEIESLPESELDDLLYWLLDKFVGGRSLMGTVESGQQTCQELARVGVTEVVCLMDFGPDTDDVLANLPRLAELNDRVSKLVIS